MVEEMTRQQLMRMLVNEHEIRGVSDFVEQIIAETLGGSRRVGRNRRGYDVLAPDFGRVEVRFRQLPKDGRIEERVSVSNAKLKQFDYLAIVILDADFVVKSVVLVPFNEVWQFVEASPYNRISYSRLLRASIPWTSPLR